MPIMTRTNSNNGMMLIKQLTGSDAERALVALVTRSALSPRPFRGNNNQISLSEKTSPQAETCAAIHALVPRDKSATPTHSSHATISRVCRANSSTYHSLMIILIAGLPSPEHDDFRADWRAVVEIDDVLVRQADTAGRDVSADGPGFIGAVDAV